METKTKQTHTPTPWHVRSVNDGHNPQVFITRDYGEGVQKFYIAFMPDGPNQSTYDDAAHIVKCVNDYDRLKRIEEKAKLATDALETLASRNEELLETLKQVAFYASINHGDKAKDYGELVKKAIAKAEQR